MVDQNLYSTELMSRLLEVQKYFTAEKYSSIIEQASTFFNTGHFDACRKELDKLPSSAELLKRLVEKLKGKSIFRTLKKIQEGKIEINQMVLAKGLSSLLTHILIECMHGNTEYKILVPSVTEKLNEVTYNILQGDE